MRRKEGKKRKDEMTEGGNGREEKAVRKSL